MKAQNQNMRLEPESGGRTQSWGRAVGGKGAMSAGGLPILEHRLCPNRRRLAVEPAGWWGKCWARRQKDLGLSPGSAPPGAWTTWEPHHFSGCAALPPGVQGCPWGGVSRDSGQRHGLLSLPSLCSECSEKWRREDGTHVPMSRASLPGGGGRLDDTVVGES